MDKDNVNYLMSYYSKVIPGDKIGYLRNRLERASNDSYENIQLVNTTSPILVLILSILLGWAGIDRFVLGDVGLGICKLLFGVWTFGIWWLIDIFLCYSKCKENNLENIIQHL